VREADVILCATTSSTPLFDGALVRDSAIVAAVGTHGRELRELDDALVSRADLVVEGRASARAENGNLTTALSEADWQTRPPANLKDLVTGGFNRAAGRPACYTGVGMSWEDLICAAAVFTK
jgi:ornithine cyclodeaminase